MPSKLADWFTPTVKARADLGDALEAKGVEWLKSKSLKLADVHVLVTEGRTAQAADREQKAQLAQAKADRKGNSVDADDVSRREAILAAALPAVIQDLFDTEHTNDARWLAVLSFARYRIKVYSVPVDPSAAPDAETKKVERVEKSDLATRADGLAALCEALRKPGREAIQAELAERGFDDAALAALEADASAVAEHGRNLLRRAEATEREAAAVRAQRIKWSAVWRLVKLAVAGDTDLETLYAKC